MQLPTDSQVLLAANKVDLVDASYDSSEDCIYLSAKESTHLDQLRQAMVSHVEELGMSSTEQVIISNLRHLHALQAAHSSLLEVSQGLDSGLSGDLLTIDIRTAIHHIGTITGEITTDEVLGNIFSKFCIGK